MFFPSNLPSIWRREGRGKWNWCFEAPWVAVGRRCGSCTSVRAVEGWRQQRTSIFSACTGVTGFSLHCEGKLFHIRCFEDGVYVWTLVLLEGTEELLLPPESPRCVYAQANSERAADVGEGVGGPVAPHNKNLCSLWLCENNRRLAVVHPLCLLANFWGIQEKKGVWLNAFSSVFKCSSSSDLQGA